jgi:hypothetical protein
MRSELRQLVDELEARRVAQTWADAIDESNRDARSG